MIAAPPERVYAAFIDPEALEEWLPPEGMTARFERFDPRPGGSYRLVLTYDDASGAHGKATADSDIVEARFVDVVPDLRVVQEVDFVADDPAFAGTMTMTWEVTPSTEGRASTSQQTMSQTGSPPTTTRSDSRRPSRISLTTSRGDEPGVSAGQRRSESFNSTLEWELLSRRHLVSAQAARFRRAQPTRRRPGPTCRLRRLVSGALSRHVRDRTVVRGRTDPAMADASARG